jgi:hypothetical protein
LTLIGETYALVRHGRNGTAANGHFNGGAQFAVYENVLLWALIGPSAGVDSADLTANLGFTWEVETGRWWRTGRGGR